MSSPRNIDEGFTLLELLLVAGLSVVLAGVASPVWLGATQRARATAAARYVAGWLQRARTEAVKRAAYAGIRFARDTSGVRMTLLVDGNGNGLRSTDISRGVDPAVGADDRLEYHFAGVQFGILDGTTSIDSAAALTGDPIRLGNTDILSFSPVGSSTSGTVYISGAGNQQLAVRVLGSTGRARVLRYHFETRQWVSP